MREIQSWDICFVNYQNSHARTGKLFIALYNKQKREYGGTTTYWYGFYINTGEQRVAGLQGSDITLSANAYKACLSHDSWINAGEIVIHNRAVLGEARDYVRGRDRQRVLNVVKESRTLEQEHISAILALNLVPSID